MKIKITSDSTCDLSPVQIAQHDIHILPLCVNVGERACRDGVDVTPDELYAHVEAGGNLPSTAANNIEDYQTVFEKYAGEYDAIIHVNISSDFSSCHQNARIAAEDFENVYVVDSRNLSTGHGLIVLKAAELAESGMDASEIVNILNELTAKVDASFILDQLEYLKKGGRCSSVAVLGANLLKLKPCIEVRDGKMGVGKKYRGNFENCLKTYITERIGGREDLDLSRVFITHSGISESCLQIAEETVRSLQPFEDVCITRAGCTVSSHCGPRTIGVLFIHK